MDKITIMPFGKYQGKQIALVNPGYLSWLKNELEKEPGRNPGLLAAIEEALSGVKADRLAKEYLDFSKAPEKPVYVLTWEGDADVTKLFESLDSALAWLAETIRDAESSEDGGHFPDPEDDRIIVWEVLPSGHRKPVWVFLGWHYNWEFFGGKQGTLPGHERTLYEEMNC